MQEVLVPSHPPVWPDGLKEAIVGEIRAAEAPFAAWIPHRLHLEWMDPSEGDLGRTRFSATPSDLILARRQRLDPGLIHIRLHPILSLDPILYKHTLVHEVIHAAGWMDHGKDHHTMVSRLAPAPTIDQSPILKQLRDELVDVKADLKCASCGHLWNPRKLGAIVRCPTCAFRQNRPQL